MTAQDDPFLGLGRVGGFSILAGPMALQVPAPAADEARELLEDLHEAS